MVSPNHSLTMWGGVAETAQSAREGAVKELHRLLSSPGVQDRIGGYAASLLRPGVHSITVVQN